MSWIPVRLPVMQSVTVLAVTLLLGCATSPAPGPSGATGVESDQVGSGASPGSKTGSGVGWELLFQDHFDDAAEALSHTGSNEVSALVGLALARLAQGRDDEAVEVYRELAASRLDASAETYLMPHVLQRFSRLAFADVKTRRLYLECIESCDDLSAAERRLVRSRLMRLTLHEGDDGRTRKLRDRLQRITEWFFIGPFENEGGAGHDRRWITPQRLYPVGNDGAKWSMPLQWRPTRPGYLPNDGFFDMANYFASARNATGYGVSMLYASAPTPCVLTLSYDGAVNLWLNGELLFSEDDYVSRNATVQIPAELVAGRNQLLAEVSGLAESPGIAVSVTSPEGGAISGLTGGGQPIEMGPEEGMGGGHRATDSSDSTQAVSSTFSIESLEVPFLTRCRRAYEADRENPRALFWYLAALDDFALEEQIRPALRELEGALGSSALVRMMYNILLAQVDEQEEARKAWHELAEEVPACVPAHWILMGEHLGQGRYTAAERLAAQLRQIWPTSAEVALFDLDLAARRGSDREMLVVRARDLIQRHPELVEPYSLLAEHYGQLGDRRNFELYTEAWRDRQGSIRAAFLRREQYVEMRDDRRRLEVDKELARLLPGSPSVWAQLGYSRLINGDGKGLDELDRALEAFPRSHDLLARRAEVHQAMEERHSAELLYDRLLQVAPADDRVREALRSLRGHCSLDEIFPTPELGDFLPSDSLLSAVEPGTPALVLADRSSTFLFPEGGSLQSRYLAVKVLNEAGVTRFGRIGTEGGAGTSNVKVIVARTIKPDGRRIEGESDGGAVGFRSLAPGDICELHYRVTSFDLGHFSAHFWDKHVFQWNLPCLLSEYQISAPTGVEVRHDLHNVPLERAIMTTDDQPGRTAYTWTMRNLPAYWGEANAPSYEESAPWLDISTIGDWKKVSQWYDALGGWAARPTWQIREKAEALTAGLTTPVEKARALYAYVRDAIKYDQVVFGRQGVVPRKAKDVLVSQFGDCKDKACLLVSLLNSQGIPASYVLTDQAASPIPRLPSPRFTHVIVAAQVGERQIFLDPTRAFHPFSQDYVPPENTWALPVLSSAEPAHWTFDRASASPDSLVVEGRISESGELDASFSLMFHDPRSVELLRRDATLMLPKDRIEQLAMGCADRGPGTTLSQARWEGDDGESERVVLTGQVSRCAAANRCNPRKVIVDLAEASYGGPDFADAVGLGGRGSPLVITGLQTNRVEEYVVSPEGGWRVGELPEDVHLEVSGAAYHRSIQLRDGRIVCRREIRIQGDRVSCSEYKAFKDVCDRITSDPGLALTLVR